jgi:endoglucanase
VSGSSSGGVSSSVLSSSSVVVIISSSSAGGGGVVVGSGGPVSVYGKLQARGNRLVGSKTGTTAVQVRGVSLFWSNTGWGGDRFFNATTVNAMVNDWKAEIIRVPMGYAANTSEGEYNGSYLDDKSGNMARVKTAVNAAIAKDVYVIIDWHSHSAHSKSADAVEFFTEMAQTYGKYDNVIFEIYNEPKNITWGTIKTYANTVIDVIRTYSDNLILVGTPNWSQDVNVAANDPISKTNIAYVVHFYANSHSLDGYTAGGSTFRSAINSVLNAGYPVFASEYGTTSADGTGTSNFAASNDWHKFMDNNKISSCAWSVSDKDESTAFFVPNFDMINWTSKMTPHGQYIYEKLNSYASSVSPPGGGDFIYGYCDYGPVHDDGGGCFPITDGYPCNEEWGWPVSSCDNLLYCDWGPITIYGGGCSYIESSSDCKASDGGVLVPFCPGPRN